MAKVNAVTFYTSGVLKIPVYFPNGEQECRWCRFLRYDEGCHRHQCTISREYLMYPDTEVGLDCPIDFQPAAE